MVLETAWAVQGGSASAEMARLQAWVSALGNSGVILPTHGKVQALATPGAGVNVLGGAAAITSTYAGRDAETYLVRNRGYVTLPVAAAPSGSSRVYYVVWQIDDYHFDNSTDPGDGNRKDALYNSFQLVSSLASMTHAYIPLAQITLPAGQGTVTNDMIKDLRSVAILQSDPHMYTRPAVTADQGRQLTLLARGGNGENFPDIGGVQLDIPKFATYATIVANWNGVVYPPNKNSWGSFWVSFGPVTDGTGRQCNTQEFVFDTPNANNNSRAPWRVADTVYIPAALRGTSQWFFQRAKYADASTDTGIYMDWGSGVDMQITFLGYPDPDAVAI